jgi:hypothetical protein
MKLCTVIFNYLEAAKRRMTKKDEITLVSVLERQVCVCFSGMIACFQKEKKAMSGKGDGLAGAEDKCLL